MIYNIKYNIKITIYNFIIIYDGEPNSVRQSTNICSLVFLWTLISICLHVKLLVLLFLHITQWEIILWEYKKKKEKIIRERLEKEMERYEIWSHLEITNKGWKIWIILKPACIYNVIFVKWPNKSINDMQIYKNYWH